MLFLKSSMTFWYSSSGIFVESPYSSTPQQLTMKEAKKGPQIYNTYVDIWYTAGHLGASPILMLPFGAGSMWADRYMLTVYINAYIHYHACIHMICVYIYMILNKYMYIRSCPNQGAAGESRRFSVNHRDEKNLSPSPWLHRSRDSSKASCENDQFWGFYGGLMGFNGILWWFNGI